MSSCLIYEQCDVLKRACLKLLPADLILHDAAQLPSRRLQLPIPEADEALSAAQQRNESSRYCR
jgi:hypothetical protein